MNYILDLHLHSKYSRATSKNLDLENIAKWAKIKGVDVCAAPDFTHPAWFKEMKKKLVKQENGLYLLRGDVETRQCLVSTTSDDNPPPSPLPRGGTYFMPVTEVACIFRKSDKTRRLHLMVFMPDFEAVEKFNNNLEKRGAKLKLDGRPILGMSGKDVLEIAMNISEDTMIVPAHAWTPWFAIFGSKSGFDSIEECFDELTPHITAIETGLSSDPPMNWRLSQLDNITLISNSDAHSPENIGREANVFEINPEDLSYKEIIRIIREGDRKKFKYTIEFFPEEGMYHVDGHRNCNINFEPKESKRLNNICPKCKKQLTIGVLQRVDDLADREVGFKNEGFIPYKSIVPLKTIISEVIQKGKATKTVAKIYDEMIEKGKSEFNILLNLSLDELKKITSLHVVEAIKRVREGKLIINPGYDGVYGSVKIFSEKEREKMNSR